MIKYKLKFIKQDGECLIYSGVFLEESETCWCKQKAFEVRLHKDLSAQEIEYEILKECGNDRI